jgi:phosphomannomutase
MKLAIADLMASSGVKFGTSGARGLVTDLTDRVAYAYTLGFLQYLRAASPVPGAGGAVAIGGDLRPSTGRIMDAVGRAVADFGGTPVNCGRVPSPALALLGLARGIPAIMVTGSHIPDDRNGIKFNKPTGEILKDDEVGMLAQTVEFDESRFDARGAFVHPGPDPGAAIIEPEAGRAYVRRYLDAFPADALRGVRLGVYQHSAVARDVLVEILAGLGAEVVPLGRSETFLPVDTEAVRPEDVELARGWAREQRFDALVSADGDSDRPLVSDETGEWLRGDVAGILAARYLDADSVTTPVSSNTAVEKCGWFPEVRRTRIGSPFVVASMLAATAAGRRRVVGYEANGGFLLDSHLTLGGRPLRALPTRDAVIVMLGVLLLARREGRSVSRLVASLPARFTASDRLQRFPTERGSRDSRPVLRARRCCQPPGVGRGVRGVGRRAGRRDRSYRRRPGHVRQRRGGAPAAVGERAGIPVLRGGGNGGPRHGGMHPGPGSPAGIGKFLSEARGSRGHCRRWSLPLRRTGGRSPKSP